VTEFEAVAAAEKFAADSGCLVGQPMTVVLLTQEIVSHYSFQTEYAGYWHVSFGQRGNVLGDPCAVVVNDSTGEASWQKWSATP